MTRRTGLNKTPCTEQDLSAVRDDGGGVHGVVDVQTGVDKT